MKRLALFVLVFLSGLAILFILVDPTEFQGPTRDSALPEVAGEDQTDHVSPNEFEELRGLSGPMEKMQGLSGVSATGSDLVRVKPTGQPSQRVRVERFGNDPGAPDQYMLVEGMHLQLWRYDEALQLQHFAVIVADRARVEKTGDRTGTASALEASEDGTHLGDFKGNIFFLGPVTLEAWTRPDDVDPAVFAQAPQEHGVPTRVETADLDFWSRERRMTTDRSVELFHGRNREIEVRGVGLELFGSLLLEDPEDATDDEMGKSSLGEHPESPHERAGNHPADAPDRLPPRDDLVLILRRDIRLVDRRGLGAMRLPGLPADPVAEGSVDPLVMTGAGPLTIRDRTVRREREEAEEPSGESKGEDERSRRAWPLLIWGQLENDVHVECGSRLEMWCDRLSARYRRHEDAERPDAPEEERLTKRLAGDLELLHSEGEVRFTLEQVTGSAETIDIEFRKPGEQEPSELHRLELTGEPRIDGLPASTWAEGLSGLTSGKVAKGDEEEQRDPESTQEAEAGSRVEEPTGKVARAAAPQDAEARPSATARVDEEPAEGAVEIAPTPESAPPGPPTAVASMQAEELIRLERLDAERWQLTGLVSSRLDIEPTPIATDRTTAILEAERIELVLTREKRKKEGSEGEDDVRSELESLLARVDAVAKWSNPDETGLFAFTVAADGIEYRRVSEDARELRLSSRPEITATLRELEAIEDSLAGRRAEEAAREMVERLYFLKGRSDGEVVVQGDATGYRRIVADSPVEVEVQDSEGSEPAHLTARSLMHEDWPEGHPSSPQGRQRTEARGNVECDVPRIGLWARGEHLEIQRENRTESDPWLDWKLAGAPAELRLEQAARDSAAHLTAWESIHFEEHETRRLYAQGAAIVRMNVPRESDLVREESGLIPLLGTPDPKGSEAEPGAEPQQIEVHGEFVSADFGPRPLDPEGSATENPAAGGLPRELIASGNVRLVLEQAELSGELLQARDQLDSIDLHGGVLGRAAIRLPGSRVLWAQDLSIDLEAERMNLFGGGELQLPAKPFRRLTMTDEGESSLPVRIRFGRNGVIDRRHARFDGGIELRLPEGDARLLCQEAAIDYVYTDQAGLEQSVRRIEAIGSVTMTSEAPRMIRGLADRLLWDVPSESLSLQGGSRRVSVTIDDIHWETIPGGTFTLFYMDGRIRASAGAIEYRGDRTLPSSSGPR